MSKGYCTVTKRKGYTTEYLLDYLYHQKYYKLIDIDLSRQANTSIPQQIKFTGNLDEYGRAIMLFIAGKAEKKYSNFFFRFINRNRIT